MAAAYGSIGSTTYASGRTTTSIPKPSGTASGDVLVAYLLQGSGTAPAVPTPPSGFTQAGGYTTGGKGGFSARISLWTKVAGGSEPTTYDFTHASHSTQGVVIRVTGSNGVVNAVLDSSDFIATSGNSDRVLTGITTTKADCLLLEFGWDWGDNTNDELPPTGMTEVLDTVLTAAWWEVRATAGATGTRSNVCNSAVINPRGGFLIALEPSAAAAGSTMKYWTGSAWVAKPLKVWNGSAWVQKPLKVWTGSAWRTL